MAQIYAGYRIYEDFDDFREWQRLHGRRRRREQPYGSYSPSWYQPGVNEKPRESASAETTGRNMQEKQAFDDLRKRAPARVRSMGFPHGYVHWGVTADPSRCVRRKSA